MYVPQSTFMCVRFIAFTLDDIVDVLFALRMFLEFCFSRSFAHLLSRTGIVGRVQQILAEANGSYKSLDFDTYNTCSCHDWAREPRHSFDRVVVLYIRIVQYGKLYVLLL